MKFSFVKYFLFTAFIIFSSLGSLAQRPVANFSATPISGCAPLVVHFSNQSVGNPTSFKWILGNGTISNLENPTAIYTNPGVYNVKLIVQNNAGLDSATRDQYITVYSKPSVDFNVSDAEACVNSGIRFSDVSTAGSGNIISRLWDFGDGSSSNISNPIHSYSSGGFFNISLQITNNYGCMTSVTRANHVLINENPNADFSNSIFNGCITPLNVEFYNNSTSNSIITNYYWEFGDGNSSSDPDPDNTYNDFGSYSVLLKVTDENGCSDSAFKPNLINITDLHALFNMPDNVCINTPVQLQNISSPTPQTVVWNFGDGTGSDSFSPIKYYSYSDTFRVKLIVQSGGCIDSVIKKITVNEKPHAEFTANPVNSCKIPQQVSFSNTTENATLFQWEFGDSGSSIEVNPTHIYSYESDYSVSLIAINDAGCRDTITKNNFIKIKLPVIGISNFPTPGCAPLAAALIPQISNADSIVLYNWNFGDGATSNSRFPNHVYQQSGEFDVTLNIVSANGCTDTAVYVKSIKVGNRPHASFSADPRAVCASTPVIFTDLTPLQDSVREWLWLFGDGGRSTMQNPSYHYSDTAGNSNPFDVTLIVTNNGCRDTITRENYITIYPPIANFTFNQNCTERLKKSFFDKSKGADSWLWNFGDGHTSNVKNPIHTFTSSGLYNITLIVFNTITGCTDTISKSLNVNNRTPDFISPDTSICKMNAALFNMTPDSYNNFYGVKWNFGNGMNGFGFPITNFYSTPGLYDVSIFTTDINGCKDTTTKRKYIKVNGPIADFTSSVTNSCKFTSVTFVDNSITDGRNSIKKWIWNYGDGVIDTVYNRTSSHTYTTSGSFSVSLEIFDSAGCSSKKIKNNFILIENPSSRFFSGDTAICPSINASFINLSTGIGNTYLWNFGDGTSSNLKNPSHNFVANGLYTVTLIATNNFGCKDTLKKTNYVRVSTPLAKFSVSDSVGNCPPLIVNFINQSQNFTSLVWSFGDNTNTISDNPSHFYSVSGNFIAKLVVSSRPGCRDSATKLIAVHGPSGSFNYDNTTGCAPAEINFEANAINTSFYIWDFSDGNTTLTDFNTQSHTYLTEGNYLPKLLLKDSIGCTVTLVNADTINIYGVQAGFLTNAHLLCDSGIVQFENTTTSNDNIDLYSWNFGDNTEDYSENPSHHYIDTGLFTPALIVVSENGCTDTATSPVDIKIVPSPRGNINQSANGCAGIQMHFNGTLVGNDTTSVSWHWDFGNGITSNETNPNPQVYTQARLYPVSAILTNAYGCKDTIYSNVEAYPYPTTDAGNDTTVCRGRGILLHAVGADEYNWSPSRGLSCINCPDPITNTDSAVIYTVTGKSIHGCVKKDSIRVEVKYPFNLSVSERQMLCNGESKKINVSGAELYTWYPSCGLDNIHSSSPVVSPNMNVIYQVVGTDNKKCFSDTAFVPVVVFNYPSVDAGEDKTINVGQSVELIPRFSSDITDFRWNPSPNQFRNTDGRITVKPNVTTTYEIEVSNAGGCKSRDAVTVNVLCNGANLYVPNTFSPNEDGMNDVFFPRGTGIFSIKSMRIFSRWGEKIFERNNFKANDVSKGWDGSFKNQQLTPDVFVYVMEVQCDNNAILTFKGDISLLK